MGKRLAVVSLAVLLASFMFIMAMPLSYGGAPTTVVYVEPPTVESETLTAGSTFNVTVKVVNIPADPGIAGFQFKLSWNFSMLNGVGMQEVMFHNVTPEAELDNLWKLKHTVANDSVSYGYTFQDLDRARAGGYMPISGNYTVAEIKLKVSGLGKTTLRLENIVLGDAAGNKLPCDSADGYFSNLPLARPPVSNFSYSPEKPRVNETVTFNGSASYDPDGTIVSYRWDFGDYNITTATIPYIAHTYSLPGNYSVTLNVTDSNGLWNTTTSLMNVRIAVHDIAITEIKPYSTTVPTNSNTNISVTVENQGDYTETFNVTLYVNNTSIESRTINNVPEKTPIVINFTWNTTGVLGSCILSATASNVTGETDEADNTLIDGQIVVRARVQLQGDMNSDGIVDIYDAILLANAINSKPGDQNWNFAADINGDNVVDIYDAILLANNYGKTT